MLFIDSVFSNFWVAVASDAQNPPKDLPSSSPISIASEFWKMTKYLLSQFERDLFWLTNFMSGELKGSFQNSNEKNRSMGRRCKYLFKTMNLI